MNRPLTDRERWAEYRRASYDVLVDFDGTLCAFAYPGMGEPLPGARKFVQDLLAMGLKPIIWSSRFSGRNATPLQVKQTHKLIADWLRQYNFPAVEIDLGNHGKRLALAYVDDRGVGFRGDYAACMAEIVQLAQKEDVKRARQEGGGDAGPTKH